jgi:hypothetical protein
MRLRNYQVQQAGPLLVCLLTSALTLPFALSGCSDPSTTTTTTATTDTSPAKPAVAFPGEKAFVTPEEEKAYVENAPDTSVKFPEDEFVRGRKLRDQLKAAEAEKVLKSKLDDAVKSAAGQTKLGQYCVRLNNVLHMQGKEKEALKYAILAGHIFYKQPVEKRPLPLWFFNVHLHQGLGYKKLRIYPDAEKQLRKAINFAASAPAGQVDWHWHRLCYMELIDTLKLEKKKPAEIKVIEADLKNLEESHR